MRWVNKKENNKTKIKLFLTFVQKPRGHQNVRIRSFGFKTEMSDNCALLTLSAGLPNKTLNQRFC